MNPHPVAEASGTTPRDRVLRRSLSGKSGRSMTGRAFLLALPIACGVGSGCSEESRAPRAPVDVAVESPALAPIVDPEERIHDLDAVEDLSEEVANRLLAWGDTLRRRDFAATDELLADGFRGHDLGRTGPFTETGHTLGITAMSHGLEDLAVVDGPGFQSGLRGFLSPFGILDRVLPKTRAAEFSVDAPTWGALTVELHVYGRDGSGGRLGRTATLRMRCERRDAHWLFTHIAVTSVRDLRRDRPIFTDVAGPAGVAVQGPRFGTPENDSFFWNGAAAADVDMDGRFDIFVVGSDHNRLYRNRGDGTFDEIAATAGLEQPRAGTGALFTDVDNDGDPDLILGQVGFVNDGEQVGGPCLLFENQGDGTFQESGSRHGLNEAVAAFSICAADVNADGWIDLYVCGYNAEGFVTPDSWHEAGNGTRNLLYLNNGDGTFTERGEAAGVDDNGWSYAAAFADIDEDGDQDLYVANDYGRNRLYINRGDGTFDDRADELGVEDVGNGMGVTFGDDDGDGDLDLYVSNMSSSAGDRILKRLYDPAQSNDLTKTLYKLAAGNSIYQWDGKRFALSPRTRGGTNASWAWSAQYLDVDLDGDEDIACANGFLSGDEGYEFKDT